MSKALTTISIANLKGRLHRYEVSNPGCQGLRVVVFPSRRKSFVVRFRYRGLQRKLTLGPVAADGTEPTTAPELDTPLSLAVARQLATQALREARSGQDPTETKRRKRKEQHAAEGDTLQAISEEYLRREGPRLRTLRQRRTDLELFYPALGRLPIEQIRRGQFIRVLDTIADTRGPVRADRALSALKTLLRWHSERSEYVSVLGPGGRRTSIQQRARSRVLSDDELRAVWLASERDKGPFGAFVRFMLLTTTRRGEAAGLRRSELVDADTWIIPGARYKSGKDTLVPLSKAAQKIIAAQPHLSDGDFVFSMTGVRGLTFFGQGKDALDAASGVTGWTLHDCRRTARTLLGRADIDPDIAERCLGHALTGVRRVYDRYEYQAEKATAFEALAAQIERIVHPPPVKVADIAAERGKRRRS